MSAVLDAAAFDPYYTDSTVGTQTDGTTAQSTYAGTPNPTDAGGGLPGSYGAQVLDLFKFGVNTYTAQQGRKDFLDYKRFEATNGGLYQQGRNAMLPKAAAGGGISGQTLLIIGGLLAFAVLTHKG